MSEILHLTDKNYEEEIKKSKILVVDFWAEWCGPCRMFAGTFEEYAKENADVTCAKINIDQAPVAAEKFGVMSIPSILVFKDGKLVTQKTGALPKAMLKTFVDSVK
ncbi:MAG: thioredoxin [archaeon]